MFFAFGIVFLGYWLGWNGYATLQQPTGANPNGIGILDLLLPSKITKVDQCIQNDWNKPLGGYNGPSVGQPGSGGNFFNPANTPPGDTPLPNANASSTRTSVNTPATVGKGGYPVILIPDPIPYGPIPNPIPGKLV
jgi:hypothetical protein